MASVLRRRALSLALLAGLLAAALALAPRAGAHIYWTTRGGDIGRANLDGSGVDRHFISGAAVFPNSIAVYRGHIYWTDGNRDLIGRANLDGSGVNRRFISFPNLSPESYLFRPHDLAVRGGYVYWTSWGSSIGRARIDGTHAQLKFIEVKKGFAPGYLAIAGHRLYWTGLGFEEPNLIGRANLDGSGIRNSFITSETSPFYLAAGHGHLYWTTPKLSIARANLDGTGQRARFLVPPAAKGQPSGLAVGGSHLYWTSLAYIPGTYPYQDTLLGWIGLARLDGTGIRWIAVGSGEEAPTDVAVVAPAGR